MQIKYGNKRQAKHMQRSCINDCLYLTNSKTKTYKRIVCMLYHSDTTPVEIYKAKRDYRIA